MVGRRVSTRSRIALALAGALALGTAPAIASAAASAHPAAAGIVAYDGTGPQTGHHRFHEVPFTRVADTRLVRSPLGQGQVRSIQIGGRAGVPTSGVAAVAVNVTAVTPTANTYLTAYKGGTSRPFMSTVNAPRGTTRSAFTILPVSSTGTAYMYNASGSTHFLVDVVGFYTADETYYRRTGRLGSTMNAGNPVRIADTRRAGAGGPILPGRTRTYTAGGAETSVILNVTVARPSGSGYLTVWGGGTRPTASTVNFEAGHDTANLTMVKTAKTPSGASTITLYNGSSVPVHVAVDALGFNNTGDKVGKRYRPVAPRRILDTRTGAAITPTAPRILMAPADVRTPTTSVLVGTVTIIKPSVYTWLSIRPYGHPKNWVSTVNADPGEIRNNGALSYTEYDKIVISNQYGAAHATYDLTGTFEHYWADEPAR